MFIIDGNHMDTRENAYRELKRALQAPEYMGSNLDALADVLGEMRGEIVLVHACTMLNSLREYGRLWIWGNGALKYFECRFNTNAFGFKPADSGL